MLPLVRPPARARATWRRARVRLGGGRACDLAADSRSARSASQAVSVLGLSVASPRIAELKTSGQAVIDRRLSLAALEEEKRIALSDLFIDEAALLAEQAFPLSEDQLILRAKQFLYHSQGVARPSLLAEDFTFMGPFVGGADGLPRADYLKAVGGFNLKDAFPDLEPRFMHFRADPLDAGRIWFTSQASGTDLGGFLGNEPTGKRFETPPQACSIKFNEEGLVVKYTIGAVMERSIGNTGGLGGMCAAPTLSPPRGSPVEATSPCFVATAAPEHCRALTAPLAPPPHSFGPAYAIGKPLPFPEANPWKPSKRYRALMLVGRLTAWLSQKRQA